MREIRVLTMFVVYSAATDFLLAFLPWRVFRRLQMNKTERIVVGVSMTFALM